jgi:putative ribosome biogenesis GTPase RsgA
MAYVEHSAKSARSDLDTYKEILQEIDQIRLVILGESGIGKSTLVSRVFGIPEEEVSKSKLLKCRLELK